MPANMFEMGQRPIDEFLMGTDPAATLDTAHIVSPIGAYRVFDGANRPSAVNSDFAFKHHVRKTA